MKEFQKYHTRGAYHWQQISNNVKKRNAFVIARYNNCVSLINAHTKKGSKVLDAGCGDGVFSYLVSKSGYRVSGVDLSPEAIKSGISITRQKGEEIDFKQGSVYEIPWEDNTFDTSASTEVIEHLDDVPQFIRELKRVTKPEGAIIITTPIRITKTPLDPEHVVEWFQEEYKELMETYFEEVEIHTSHPVAYMDIYQARYFGQLLGRLVINILSFIKNPFSGFDKKYTYQAIQYAVVKNKK